MKLRRKTYTAYSIACGVVWAVILVFSSFALSASKRDTIIVVCLGWAIGWLSATIARSVYPPPRARRSPGQPTA